ncbi:MAG: hypothetical protein ABI759_28720 [Candidatus Solibacter sp.]
MLRSGAINLAAAIQRDRFDTTHESKYQLRTLPGSFSGSQLLCYEYVAFKQIAPEMDIGWDVAKEFAEAKKMREMGL